MDTPLIHLLSDDPERGETIGRLLAPSCRVRPFGRTADLLARLDEEPAPDLLLADVVASGSHGVGLCAQLRKSPAGPAVPVMFVTAPEEVLPVLRALLACGNDFVAWPIGADALLARIELHLRGRPRRGATRSQPEQLPIIVPSERLIEPPHQFRLGKLATLDLRQHMPKWRFGWGMQGRNMLFRARQWGILQKD